MGITDKSLLSVDAIPHEYKSDRTRIEAIFDVFVSETGTKADAYEKLVEELTFTLFNRLAAIKMMEAHTLFPEIITRRETHGGRSFSHLAWLEQHPEQRSEENEGLILFIEDEFKKLADAIPLFSLDHPYHLLPTSIELNGIIAAFNKIETDPQVEPDIWLSDDVMGWLYESYNNEKKAAHKASGDKTEYNKVSIQSQVYTPRWVVKFLVDNSLGKLYLEMYPDSEIKAKYKIANAPAAQIRKPKPLTEIRLIDPATGSGNFLLYAFDLFYDIYLDQIENYGADYDENRIGKLIIENNLYGVDLDNRAVQLAQLGLYIKAKRRKRNTRIEYFNVVSSDFWLPDYEQVKEMFEADSGMDAKQKEIIRNIWGDLQQSYKFGSLIRLEEKLSVQLHGLQKDGITLFAEQEVESYENFRENFFINLQRAVTQYADKQGHTFLNIQAHEAITFLQVITQKYDVAVANPPYTDSSDFGAELKKFIDANYRQPYKFNTNLYATFIKRCIEITSEEGKIALIHPLTFMYIKTFEDVRKYLIEHLHINVFVDYGLSNLFGLIMADPAFYVLEKTKTSDKAWFVSLNQYTRTPNEKYKKDFCLEALDDYIGNRPNKHNISIDQSKLKIIDGWPFIYWISDGFREKFEAKALNDVLNPRQGIATGNNDRCIRYWWEIKKEDISLLVEDNLKWKIYSKGGPYNKWYGNFWTVIDFSSDGYDFLLNNGNHLPSRNFYFQEGATYSASGSKGVTFRYMPFNRLFDVGGSCIFMGEFKNVYYSIAFLNSNISYYLADCLNPTVNIQVGDIKRIPFVFPPKDLERKISLFASINITLKQQLCIYSIIETNFDKNPLSAFSESTLQDRVHSYLNFENRQLSVVLLNEAIIDELIYEVYELSEEDRHQVEAKMGLAVGALPITQEARELWHSLTNETLSVDNDIRTLLDKHIGGLAEMTYDAEKKRGIVSEMASLYQTNNNLEEFCIRHQVNPLDVTLWFSQHRVVPQARAAQIALEFLADAFRTIQMEDDDGIVPLVGLPGEARLLDRLEQYCMAQGFTSAQFTQLDGLLGRPLNEYIEQHFFRNLSDRLNLFMYLPKTPFIWHLSSGVNQGFEAYVIIYKWNRDSLFKLKSNYISKRTENLEFRLIQLQGMETAQSQNERETIRLQLREIEQFTAKVDELIAEGYNPILDDGVGKNIAPLQKKGMLKAEVLKTTGRNSQLEKYLNADW